MSVSIQSNGLNNIIKQNQKMLKATEKTYKKSLNTSKAIVKEHQKIYKINKEMNNETTKAIKKQETSMKMMEKLSLRIKNIFSAIGKMGWLALLSGAVAGLGMIFNGMNAKRNKYKTEATATEERLGMAKGTLYQEVKGRNANYIGNGLYDKYDNVSLLNGFNKANGANGQSLFERLYDVRRQYNEYKQTGQTTEDLNNMMKFGTDYLEQLSNTNSINEMIDIFKNTAAANRGYGEDILNNTLLANTGFDYAGLMKVTSKFKAERDEHETESTNPFMEALRWFKEEFLKSDFVKTITECLKSLVDLFAKSVAFASHAYDSTKEATKKGYAATKDTLLDGSMWTYGKLKEGYYNLRGQTDKAALAESVRINDYHNRKIKYIDDHIKDPHIKEQKLKEGYEEYQADMEKLNKKYNLNLNISNNDTSTTINVIKR